MTAFLRRPLMAGFVACALLLPALPAHTQEPRPLPQPAQVLEITVQENVAAAPELAHIGAGVMTTAKTAAEAMQENAKHMTAVYDTLRKAGISEKDMQTAGISLNAQYDYSSSRGGEQPRLVGYQATNNVNIIVRDLAALGKTLDAVVASGANQINGPSFDVKDREAHLNKARATAVANATARAEIYAKAAGLKLRKIVSITEQPQHGGPVPMMNMRAMSMDGGAAQTPVAAGSLDIGLSALIRFELGE
jgi:uncharacterized protein YggE